ncbi:hypothetical protein LCGC14_2797400, partial [marine sediment metagenome]
IEDETAETPRPMSRTEKIRLGLMGLTAAAVIFAVSSVFVDYRGLFERIAEGVTTLDPKALKLEADTFAEYFVVEVKAVANGGRILILTLKRTKDFPLDDAACERLLGRKEQSLSARLAVEALARGYVRCEYFDKKGKFLGFTSQRISGLRKAETIELPLPIPREPRPARIVVAY